jgi:O-methyltransferase
MRPSGLYEETLPKQPATTIAFAHVDCDWYEPVTLFLKYVAPRLSPGGIIILDDYNDWPGCKKASDEFCARHPELEVKRRDPHCVLRRRFGTLAKIGHFRRAVALELDGFVAGVRDRLR